MYTENDIETAVIKHFYSQQKIASLNIKCLYLKMSGYFVVDLQYPYYQLELLGALRPSS